MTYKSRRIMPYHRKRVWVGKGRRRAMIRSVNIGVFKIKKIKKPMFHVSSGKMKSRIFKTQRIRKPTIGLPRIRKLSYSSIPLKSYGADIPVKEIGEMMDEWKTVEPGPSGQAAGAAFTPEDIGEIDRTRQYAQQKEAIRESTKNLKTKIRNVSQQWDTTDDINKKNALEREHTAYVFLKEKAENEFNNRWIHDDLLALGKGIEKVGMEDAKQGLLHSRELSRLQLKSASLGEESNKIIREMQKAKSEEDLREQRKEMYKLWDEYGIFKKKQEALARKLNPFGINIKIAPMFGDRGFGNIKFASMKF